MTSPTPIIDLLTAALQSLTDAINFLTSIIGSPGFDFLVTGALTAIDAGLEIASLVLAIACG
jgi:hypothetical protein